MNVLTALTHSRKVWLAVAGIVVTLLSSYAGVSNDTLLIVNALLGVLIASIAFEDAGGKWGESAASMLTLIDKLLRDKAAREQAAQEAHLDKAIREARTE
jgi:hypothetical protein